MFAEILNGYSIPSANGIEVVTGRFNNSIQNTKLIIIDEMGSSERAERSNFDKLKKLITEPKTQIERKYENPKTIINVCSFIILSNHDDPIKLENDDRRYVVTRTSPIYVNDLEYCSRLSYSFN